MRSWAIILGGLTVWAAHFLAVYAIASAFPGQGISRWLVFVASAAALGANGVILWYIARLGGDALDEWIRIVGKAGAALSIVAVLWQTAPAMA